MGSEDGDHTRNDHDRNDILFFVGGVEDTVQEAPSPCVCGSTTLQMEMESAGTTGSRV